MLKTTLETLEGVDDAVKAFYAETDGVFILQVEGVDSHPDVVNLKSAYEATKLARDAARAERDTAKAELKSKKLPKDFDPEKWEKLKDGKPDEAALIHLRKELESERDEWRTKAEQAEAKALKSALDRDLTDALTSAGVTSKSFVQAARAMLAPKVKMDDGAPIVETDMGPLPLADHVKRWAAGEGKDFVAKPGGGGAGANGGGNGVVTKEQFASMGDADRTALFKDDPQRFRELSGAK